MSPEEKKKLKSSKQSWKKENQKVTQLLVDEGILKPNVLKGKLQTKGNIVKSDDNSSDHATPSYIFNQIVESVRKLLPDFGNDDTTIDLCCDETNSKFKVGLTENGSIGMDVKLNGDALEQDWTKLPFKYGWMAAPAYTEKYGNKVQAQFVEMAARTANKTKMIIVAFIQASVGSAYFQDYVSYDNPNCTYVELRGRLKFNEYVNVPGFDNVIAIFGLPKGSLPDEIRDEIRFIRKYKDVKESEGGRILPSDMSGKKYKNWLKS